MKKRKWTNIKVFEKEIIRMREAGNTRQEIADALGLEKKQIKNWINRYNQTQAQLKAGIKPRPQGRPRKSTSPVDIVTEQAYEIKRLKMENELLRDFLRSTERK